MRGATDLTLMFIRGLAMRSLGRVRALDSWILDHQWGPAHEIAHFLMATPAQRMKPSYGLCLNSEECDCHQSRCVVHEAAVMQFGARLMRLVGRDDLIDKEIKDTAGMDRIMDRRIQERARSLRARRGFAVVPRTRINLEKAVMRELG